MPRSSRHKSSKHSSREAREYSDSEKDSSLKDRKSKEDSSGGVRVSKDSGSSDKRKLDSKEGKDSYGGGSGNGDYSEDYSTSSKRRKEKPDDRANDRWNGGEDDYRGSGEGSKKTSKISSDSKSRRRDGSVGMYEEGDELKKSSSSGKGEGRHKDRDSSRKEGRESSGLERDREKEREREREREKKGKEGRSERLSGSDEHRSVKQGLENTGANQTSVSEPFGKALLKYLGVQVELGSPEPDSQLERRMRKRRDGSVDVGKHQDDAGETSSRRLSSRDDSAKDGKQKDEKRKDERYKEKHREDTDRDKHREEKHRDEHFSKDYPSSRSDDRHSRDEKDITAEIQQKKSKLLDGERKGESDRNRDRSRDLDLVRDRDRDRDRDRHHDREHERDRVRERDREYDRGRDHDHDRDHDWDWDHERERDEDRDRNREHDREHNRDRDRDRDREHDHDFDRDYGSHLEDRAAKYKDSNRGKRRSPDGHDDLNDSQSRAVKARYSDLEKKSLSGDRIEADVSKGRSHSRQAYADTPVSSTKRRMSPSSCSHGGVDEYRHLNPEDSKYKDSITEQRSKAIPSRDISGFSGASERGAKYRSAEKPNKIDDSQIGELSNERSSSSKASPLGLVERSPSSSSVDRRYMNRSAVRRSLDIEETGRRNSAPIDNRDFCANEDRLNRDLPLEKPLVDESSPADSSFYIRTSQANSSLVSPNPAFRAGVDSPSFIGSLEDDGRVNSNARYRRSSDPNVGRGHNNAWRGVPNWTSPVPNGFIPFQHGPPHGGFQGMMPQFPAPLFSVRPSMEINHAGMPYHIPDADRFSSHLRPLGWQNMMDGSGPSHLHAWDGNNGAFRDEHPMYASEWDQNRHPMNGRGWESNADMWKGQNGDAKRDVSSPSHKEDHQLQPSADEEAGHGGQMFNYEDNHDNGVAAKLAEVRSTVTSPAEDSKPKVIHEKTLDPARSPTNDISCLSRHYLSKLDISAELTRRELFDQCLSLLDIDQSTAVNEDTTDYIILEDGSGAALKSSNTLLIASHFPPVKDTVFQRAMDLYKKQMVDTSGKAFVTGGTLDFISASKQKNEEEQVHFNVPRVKDSIPTTDAEMSDAPISNLDLKSVEAEADPSSGVAEEKAAERVSSAGEELHIHISPSSKLEGPNLDNNQDNLGEPEPISSGVKMEVISSELQLQQQVETKEADVDGFLSVEIASRTVTTTPSAVGDNLKGISNNTSGDFETEESGVAYGDATNGPLCIPDGSPKGCEALISGSKESESIILSRIHHSPESTH